MAEKNDLPVTTESVTAGKAAETINVMNVEDTVKYLPSLLVRKRYIGDTQAPIATRTTGINASARSLIFADGVLLSTLINNNNANGSPQWFMVSPAEIERIDVMYGPYSAAYAGNSYGAVVEMTTRMPKKFETELKLNQAWQNFSLYGTSDTFRSQQESAIIGNRSGDLSWWLSANHLDSYSQPISFGTVTPSAGGVGGLPVITSPFPSQNRFGAPIQVVGAGNISHAVQDGFKMKLAYDFTPAITAAYTLGYWSNNTRADSQSYLTDATGAPFYGAATGNVNIGGVRYSASSIATQFSSSVVQQEHYMQSLSLKTRTYGTWDWEAAYSNFDYARDTTRSSASIAPPVPVAPNLYPSAQNGGPGSITNAGGTGWSTLDLKGIWRPQGATGPHSVSFGVHDDQYTLASPVFATGNWTSGGEGALNSDSRGNTQTQALWVQDAWRFAPRLKATLGGRYESWRAYGGYNFSTNSTTGTGFPVNQPEVKKKGFSPKFSLAWDMAEQWLVTGSLGKALRFPTVGELYQNVATGATFTQANPNLKPENVLAGELALEGSFAKGKLRISVFQENVSGLLFSQTSIIPGIAAPVAFVQNLDATRQRGIEVAAQQNDFLIRGLEINGSVTYVDAKILANGSYIVPATSPAGSTSAGRRTPYVPDWRATVVATYRPDDRWSYTVAGRYQSKLWATIDNTDFYTNTYQGFSGFFVADARVRYQLAKQWSAAVGIDNIFNQKYWLFHPFPQRTASAELKFSF